jgi:8-oxo-dGTP diphosphatase
VVAGLILNQQGQLLICQRTALQPLPLKWEFPGGKIEEGEDLDEALRRELNEELGIAAEIGEEIATLQHRYQNGNSVELHFLLVREFSGEVENRIFQEVRWAYGVDLPNYDFLDADRELIRDLATGKLVLPVHSSVARD